MKALITGGTRGIGWAMAKELLRKGIDVTVTGTKRKGSGPVGTSYRPCDFSKPISIHKTQQSAAVLDSAC